MTTPSILALAAIHRLPPLEPAAPERPCPDPVAGAPEIVLRILSTDPGLFLRLSRQRGAE